MIKVHHTEDHEEIYKAEGGHMARVFEDRYAIKSASEAFDANALREYAPDKDHFMMHLIAMGDQETFGPNKNGDGFPKVSLEKYANTFVTHGCFFREHRNKDQKTQGIGQVKAAAYNPVMRRVELIVWGHKKKAAEEFEAAREGKPLSYSMSCFPAGTPVLRPDGTTTPIEKLEPGDKVVTHHGNVGGISHTMSRDYSGPGVSIRPYGLPADIVSTAEHPIWVRPDIRGLHECPVCGGHFKSLKAHLRQKKDVKHQAAYADVPRYCEGFRRADQLVPGDHVRLPVTQNVEGDVDRDLAWLLGLYLAEGHIYRFSAPANNGRQAYNYARLDLTLSHRETDLAEKARGILQSHTTNKVIVFRQNGRNVLKVRLTATEGKDAAAIMDWLQEHGGHLGQHKKLSAAALAWPPASQKCITEGWLDGAGSWSIHNGHLSGVTTSERLAHHMQIILARNGLSSTLSSSGRDGKKRAYLLQVPEEGSEVLDFCRKPDGWHPGVPARRLDISHLKHQGEDATGVRVKPQTLVYVDAANGHIYARLRKVRRVHLEEKVYDLTVPGDHGFVAGGIGVSNCRVPEDRCNVCDHRAKRPSDYCGHLKESMLQYVPEFEKYAFAINDDPTFFDISRVAKPADRIAHYLSFAFPDEDMRKAASEQLGVITGTQWAEAEGVMIPDSPWGLRRTYILEKLAAAENFLDKVAAEPDIQGVGDMQKAAFARNIVPAAVGQGELSEAALNTFKTMGPGTLFHGLSKRATLLPFVSFAAYATGQTVKEASEDPDVKEASCMLPGIFKTLSRGGMPDIASLFDSAGPEMASCGTRSDEIDQLMDEASDRFSIGEGPVRNRVISITISLGGKPQPCGCKAASEPDNQKAAGLAKAYGIYKIAAIKDMLEIHGISVDESQYLLAAGQNRFFN